MVERGVMIIHKMIGRKEVVCGMDGELMYVVGMYVVGMTANGRMLYEGKVVGLCVDDFGAESTVFTADGEFLC